jgi:hypothetical protein
MVGHLVRGYFWCLAAIVPSYSTSFGLPYTRAYDDQQRAANLKIAPGKSALVLPPCEAIAVYTLALPLGPLDIAAAPSQADALLLPAG